MTGIAPRTKQSPLPQAIRKYVVTHSGLSWKHMEHEQLFFTAL